MHADPLIARGAHLIEGEPDNFEVYTIVSELISIAGVTPAIDKVCNVRWRDAVGVLQPACVIQTDRSHDCHPCQLSLLASPPRRMFQTVGYSEPG